MSKPTRQPLRTTAVQRALSNVDDPADFELLHERLLLALRELARNVLRGDKQRRITLQTTILAEGAFFEFLGRLDPWMESAGLPTFRDLLDEDLAPERLVEILNAIAPPLVRFMKDARVDALRKRKAKKRGGDRLAAEFDLESVPAGEASEQLEFVTEKIELLREGRAAGYDGDQARAAVVGSFWLLGFDKDVAATALSVSEKTVQRERGALRAYLLAEWEGSPEEAAADKDAQERRDEG